MNGMRLLIVLLGLSLVSGLSQADEQRGRDGQREVAEPELSEEIKPGERPALVTLLEEGAEPRRELRYSPNAGDVQRIIIKRQTTASQSVGGFEPPATRDPEARAVAHLEVGRCDDNGIEVRVRFVDIDVVAGPDSGHAVANARIQMNALKDRTVELRLDNRGIIRSLQFDRNLNVRGGGLLVDPPPYLILHTLRGSIVPLPSEPVGTGAKWRVITGWEEAGIVPERETVYTITAMDEEAVELTVETTAWVHPQKVAIPGAQNVELLTWAARESGRDEWVPGWIIPRMHERRAVTDMEFELALPLAQKVEAVSSIAPAAEVDAADDEEDSKNGEERSAAAEPSCGSAGE